MKFYSAFFLIILVTLTSSTIDVKAQDKLLGKIDFPNSGAEAAQADFIEGVKFLHNFEYEDAARAFQRAREIDPDFAMAHYGEAKSHNHPIWFQQNRQAAMDVLTNLGETVESRQAKASTQREKDLLMSLEILYGNTAESEGRSKEERDDLYMEYMADLHEKYPNDHEITAFYGLSILGSAHEGRDYATYMKAAAELFDVWNKNQEHPGAAHYLIHSFDDPIHAPLGLPMAKAYSKIAPAAAHAQHMTSHIFLALGMWEETIDANIVARDVQQSREKELGEQATVCGHYTWWLEYGYLQRGKTEEAREVLQTCYDRIKKEPTGSEKWHFSIMRGHQIVETEIWSAAEEWAADYENDNPAAINYYFTTALSAIKMGDVEKARQNLADLMKTPASKERDIQVNQIKSLLLIEEGNAEEGIKLLRETVVAESELPVDFGPPTIVKPSYELLGDVFLELGNYEEALEAYEKQLQRTPKRRRSLLGKDQAGGMASK
ncbi:MAG TPA: tetratricopeptide repeat protein [Gracilimonas sp.]|uniref:tetratricopeptide repeat protein n=1 Tax=Gracilimonas sp. TaxID=1974203 RepID=UPI002DABC074|nr:tetratricopeptide repeat protein [Gracilimonas sp.]